MADPLAKIKAHKELVEECLTFPGELTDWERDFLLNIQGRLMRHYPLSEKQEIVLKKLEQKLIERLD